MNKKVLIILLALIVLAGAYWFSVYSQNMESAGDNTLASEESVVTLPYLDGINDVPLKSGRNPSIGNFLTDSNGFTLYSYKKDGPQKSNCNDACTENWIPFLSFGDIKIQEYTDELTSQVNYTERTDGKAQFSFGRSPLYYYKGDAKPGDISGHNIEDGDWSVVFLPE